MESQFNADETAIENNVAFKRGMAILDRSATPQYLIAFWRAANSMPARYVPYPEVYKPWFRGLEHLI